MQAQEGRGEVQRVEEMRAVSVLNRFRCFFVVRLDGFWMFLFVCLGWKLM